LRLFVSGLNPAKASGIDDKDLIYEGIATRLASRYFHAPDFVFGRQRPDLRRDCDQYSLGRFGEREALTTKT